MPAVHTAIRTFTGAVQQIRDDESDGIPSVGARGIAVAGETYRNLQWILTKHPCLKTVSIE